MIPVFVDGVPARITADDFRRHHLDAFPKLSDPAKDQFLRDAIDDVYAMFHGAQTLWDWQPDQVWFEKTQLLFRLLVAWYIVDVYPAYSAGVSSMGGVPLRRKKIGGVDIQYADSASPSPRGDYLDLLGALKSNAFGAKAYGMIRASGKLALLRNWRAG
jgi:hypothetical protein